MNRQPIFLSSVQKEFAAERVALRDFLQGDPLLRRFFEPVLFEDLPASDRRADILMRVRQAIGRRASLQSDIRRPA
jgi:hypothetical protein